MIHRSITPFLKRAAKHYPIIAITGPRQSGKTTLAKSVFKDYEYVSMENLDTRAIALEDPRRFFYSYSKGAGLIIDEIQEVPELFSYLQGIVDEEFKPGFFVITGSQNFLMHEKITQTLAGRVALMTLLPLTIHELKESKLFEDDLDKLLVKGFYPRLYVTKDIDINEWFSFYITTYVEKDVRQILNVSNIVGFQRFLKLCAARVGNILNYAELARDCDISLNTAKSWISILESSYIVKLLYPYHRNYSKRVIKRPKLYFYDTGLICALLGIKDAQNLNISPFRGHIFESFVISEGYKYNFNNSQTPNLYFWRDVQGHEVDCIVEKSFDKVIPLEIKSSMTFKKSIFKNILEWQNIAKQTNIQSYAIYSGQDNIAREYGELFSWRSIHTMFENIYKNS